MERHWDVIVVGAGLAGFTAAATAAGAGASVLVLDGQHPGGRATTDEVGGYRLNRGAHAFYRGGAGRGVLERLGVTRAWRLADPDRRPGAPGRPGRRARPRDPRGSRAAACSRRGTRPGSPASSPPHPAGSRRRWPTGRRPHGSTSWASSAVPGSSPRCSPVRPPTWSTWPACRPTWWRLRCRWPCTMASSTCTAAGRPWSTASPGPPACAGREIGAGARVRLVAPDGGRVRVAVAATTPPVTVTTARCHVRPGHAAGAAGGRRGRHPGGLRSPAARPPAGLGGPRSAVTRRLPGHGVRRAARHDRATGHGPPSVPDPPLPAGGAGPSGRVGGPRPALPAARRGPLARRRRAELVEHARLAGIDARCCRARPLPAPDDRRRCGARPGRRPGGTGRRRRHRSRRCAGGRRLGRTAGSPRRRRAGQR